MGYKRMILLSSQSCKKERQDTVGDDVADAITEHWDISYRHAPGRINRVFFDALKQGKLLQRDCACCNRRSVPPCACWDQPGGSWCEAKDTAVLIASVPLEDAPGVMLALIRLDGTDTLLVQHVRGADREIPKGAPLRLVFAARPEGKMEDFWFEPDTRSIDRRRR